MLLVYRNAARYPRTPPNEVAASTSPDAPKKATLYQNEEESSSWDVLSISSSLKSSSSATSASSPCRDITRDSDDCSPFDTQTFPEQAYLFPSDRNGTVLTGTVYSIRHPVEAVSTINDNLDVLALRYKLKTLAELASESVNERVNRACEGYDVVEMGNRVMSLIPLVSMPTMRDVEHTVDAVSGATQSLTKRRHSETKFLNQELQGDQWAFARLMGAKVRKSLIKQNICKEWQLVPIQSTMMWHSRLNAALAAYFMAEKQFYSVICLFSMTPVWIADNDKKVWHLELDTGLTDIAVEGDSDAYTEQSICIPVGFELQECCGNRILADVQREAVHGEDEWMIVVEQAW